MSLLTAAAVEAIFTDCLFVSEAEAAEVGDRVVKAEGIVTTYGFHPDRLEKHRAAIAVLLRQLPPQFHAEGGGGWSFLNACMDKDGNQWGEQPTVDCLVVLGIATGMAKYLMAREMWPIFPGGMPYFVVTAPEENDGN